MTCQVCGGDCTFLGILGQTFHFRCRDCGMDQHTQEPSEEVVEEFCKESVDG